MAISEKYLPGEPPFQASPELRHYLDEELRRIADLVNQDIAFTEPLNSEPSKPENGMIVYADGTDWNPGSGEGFYGYESGAWVKL